MSQHNLEVVNDVDMDGSHDMEMDGLQELEHSEEVMRLKELEILTTNSHLLIIAHMKSIMGEFLIFCTLICAHVHTHVKKHGFRPTKFVNRHRKRKDHINDTVWNNDETCVDFYRMDRYTFRKLCTMLTTTGKLKCTKKHESG